MSGTRVRKNFQVRKQPDAISYHQLRHKVDVYFCNTRIDVHECACAKACRVSFFLSLFFAHLERVPDSNARMATCQGKRHACR